MSFNVPVLFLSKIILFIYLRLLNRLFSSRNPDKLLSRHNTDVLDYALETFRKSEHFSLLITLLRWIQYCDDAENKWK